MMIITPSALLKAEGTIELRLESRPAACYRLKNQQLSLAWQVGLQLMNRDVAIAKDAGAVENIRFNRDD